MSKSLIITDEVVTNKIYLIRGKKVMMDRDLAEMYGVETRRLNEQVKRNEKRFPNDFMFQMTHIELEDWKSRFATSKKEKMGLRKLPYVFTEQGVAMLSSVLNSETAIEVNIGIIRVFTRMREMLITQKDVLLKLEQIEKKVLKQDSKLNKHEKEMQVVFKALKELLNPKTEPMRKIGFKQKED
ncbi:MAG TPA: DNA-binding protein [Cytophagales bacterium]|nr:DNA-binding protein [Cytophagales bacterium]HRG10026.1 ORF6N domain-containing protein [Cyclobacteriaceae bacterium]